MRRVGAGAAGFIGSYLVNALLSTGHEVVGSELRSSAARPRDDVPDRESWSAGQNCLRWLRGKPTAPGRAGDDGARERR